MDFLFNLELNPLIAVCDDRVVRLDNNDGDVELDERRRFM
jgi:hypothetical protein